MFSSTDTGCSCPGHEIAVLRQTVPHGAHLPTQKQQQSRGRDNKVLHPPKVDVTSFGGESTTDLQQRGAPCREKREGGLGVIDAAARLGASLTHRCQISQRSCLQLSLPDTPRVAEHLLEFFPGRPVILVPEVRDSLNKQTHQKNQKQPEGKSQTMVFNPLLWTRRLRRQHPPRLTWWTAALRLH